MVDLHSQLYRKVSLLGHAWADAKAIALCGRQACTSSHAKVETRDEHNQVNDGSIDAFLGGVNALSRIWSERRCARWFRCTALLLARLLGWALIAYLAYSAFFFCFCFALLCYLLL